MYHNVDVSVQQVFVDAQVKHNGGLVRLQLKLELIREGLLKPLVPQDRSLQGLVCVLHLRRRLDNLKVMEGLRVTGTRVNDMTYLKEKKKKKKKKKKIS